MKKLLISILAVVLVSALGFVLVACNETGKNNDQVQSLSDSPQSSESHETAEPFETIEIPMEFEEEIPETRSYTLANGTEYKMTLESTREDGERLPEAQYYCKESGRFTFNTDWDLIKWEGGFETSVYDRHGKIDEEGAVVAANEFLRAFLGEDFEEEYDVYEITSRAPSPGWSFMISYYTHLGNDGFLKHKVFEVNVTPRGKVSSYDKNNPLSLRNLDPAILEKISQADIDTFIDGVLNKVGIKEYDEEDKPIFGYDRYVIKAMNIRKNGDDFCICITAHVNAYWINKSEHIANSELHSHGGFKDDPDEFESFFSTVFIFPLENE